MTKRKLPTPYSMVCVEWIDSCEPDDNAEVPMHEVPKPQQIYQVGLLIKDEKNFISVAGAWKSEDKVFDYVITIPKSAVRRIIRLR